MGIEVSLANCDQEPIHIPGSIQPHGALLAFDADGKLAFVSANMDGLLGTHCRLGHAVAEQGLPRSVVERVLAWQLSPSADFESFDLSVDDNDFDVVAHRNADDLLIVEFEIRSASAISVASFALIAHKAIERLKRQRNVEEVLGLAAAEVRKITGFDRVMAYRFRHDDSGEVVRESRREGLENWEGRRYPSSDIPAQARRLYVLNTLRLIARVDGETVPVLQNPGAAGMQLDMSFCGLRSVSPIHIEYLTNMEVAASLSISVVINGALWGMIACHHHEPRQVPHGIRLACEVLGQMLSLTIAGLEMAAMTQAVARATEMLALIGVRARAADDLLQGVAFDRPNPADLIQADVTLCLWGGKVKVCSGDISADAIKELSSVLAQVEQDTLVSSKISDTHPQFAAAISPFCGMLAVSIDVSQRGWVVWLRAEQIEHVRWAGKPEKLVKTGPNGPRLTPRGSFSEWREEVRGSSIPWHRSDLETSAALRSELNRIAGAHAIEMERVRLELLAALGHDLRGPLQSISTAAQILQLTRTDDVDLGARIQASSGRMSRLVMQILDMSRLQSNSGISLMPENFDLVTLLREMTDEAQFTHPGTEIALMAPESLVLFADRDRLSQVIANLLSNARHHGVQGRLITVFARVGGDRVQFGVVNTGEPIPADVQRGLFKAFKRGAEPNVHNRTGLGLGLYIASEIMVAHGGELSVHCGDGLTTFTGDISRSGVRA